MLVAATATTVAVALLFTVAPTAALPKMTRATSGCPVQNGNLVDPVLFVNNETQCEELCASNEACLYFYFFEGDTDTNSVDATDQPSQCFLYDGCTREVFPATPNCPLKR